MSYSGTGKGLDRPNFPQELRNFISLWRRQWMGRTDINALLALEDGIHALLSDKLNDAHDDLEQQAERWLRRAEEEWNRNVPAMYYPHLSSEPPRRFICERLAIHVRILLSRALAKREATLHEGLVVAWRKYKELFGEPPHGTEKQMAALLELIPKEKE